MTRTANLRHLFAILFAALLVPAAWAEDDDVRRSSIDEFTLVFRRGGKSLSVTLVRDDPQTHYVHCNFELVGEDGEPLRQRRLRERQHFLPPPENTASACP